MAKKIRVYISGPITGTADYMERFEEAEKRLNGEFSVINPAKLNSNMPDDTTHEEYMKMSICMLSMCDAIFMLNGWEDSVGACEENIYALKNGMRIFRE